MMNYQRGGTPPVLATLDPSEVEQSLYRRRDANADTLQPLQINYGTGYYPSAPPGQRSAPIPKNGNMPPPSNQAMYCKTAAVQASGTTNTEPLNLPVEALSINVCNASAAPNECTGDPSINTIIPGGGSSGGGGGTLTTMSKHHLPLTQLDHGYSTRSSQAEITSITPNTVSAITPHSGFQHHRPYLSAHSPSNHSSASNNTMATTIIESASNGTPSNRSPNVDNMYGARGSNANLNTNAVHSGNTGTVSVTATTAPPPGYGPVPLSTRSKQIQDDLNDIDPIIGAINQNGSTSTVPRSNNPYPVQSYTANNVNSIVAPDRFTYGTTPPLPHNRYPAATAMTNYYANQPATAPVLHQYPSPPRLNANTNNIQQYPAGTMSHGVNGQYVHNAVNALNQGYPMAMYPPTAGTGQPTAYYQHPAGYIAAVHGGHSPRSHSQSIGGHSTSYHRSSHSSTFSFNHTPSRSLSEDTVSSESASVTLLQRCDGSLVSPHADPSTLFVLTPNNGSNGTNCKLDELTFTAGDDAWFGVHMVTVISVNWTTSIPFATVRVHSGNRIYHVPLMDLVSVDHYVSTRGNGKGGSVHSQSHLQSGRSNACSSINGNGNGNNIPNLNSIASTPQVEGGNCGIANSDAVRYRISSGGHGTVGSGHNHNHNGNVNGNGNGNGNGNVNVNSLTTSNADGVSEELRSTIEANIGALISRRNPKLSDETLMKLPHLRKHREYLRTIDVSMGPRDYNSYRVSVHSKDGDHNNDHGMNGNGNGSGHHHGVHQHRRGSQCPENDNVDGNGRTANIQNLSAKPRPADHSGSGSGSGSGSDTHRGGGLSMSSGGGRNRSRSKRMSLCDKGDLFKTELCENWVKKGHCTYGKKCHFAHGREDIRTRWRIENYKTQPCCDPARADSRLCLFGKRCNYAHPGEPLRRSHHCLYLDEEYEAEIAHDFGSSVQFPFGIYI